MSQNIKFDINNMVACLQLDKKPLNILDIEDINLINRILEDLNSNDKIKVLVIKSALNHFSAGMNINEHTEDKIDRLIQGFMSLAKTLLQFKYPTISLVRGVCFGGGMELTLLTDMILASEDAQFGQPEIKLAHIAPFALNLLPLMTGTKKAFEILITGETLTADKALQSGIVNRVFPVEQFESLSRGFIESITSLSQASLISNVKAFRRVNLSEFLSLQHEINEIYLNEIIKHPDSLEGIRAFNEKRKPEWKY